MVWKVRRTNRNLSDEQIAVPDYATGVLAYDAAWDNMGTFIKANIRSGSTGNDTEPESADAAYKIYVRYQVGHELGFELVYDWPTGDLAPLPSFKSNSIFWEVIEIP